MFGVVGLLLDTVELLLDIVGLLLDTVGLFLDTVGRVIMSRHSTLSQGVLCHVHSPHYISQSLNNHFALSLKQAVILYRTIRNN